MDYHIRSTPERILISKQRKAGLMKKAWELSVLCAADVSIIIFSAAGKAFEFSSKELDSEIDRYLNVSYQMTFYVEWEK